MNTTVRVRAAHRAAGLLSTDPTRVGRWDLVGRLGAGGMGTVYLGIDEAAKLAAVKVLHPHLSSQPGFLERFRREASLATQVDSRFTARVIAVDFEASVPFLATEYVPAPSLAEKVDRDGPLPQSLSVPLAIGLTQALAAIHATGIVHRDLTPRNVLLAEDGPKVVDFGISRGVGQAALTSTGTMGTPGWVAPEVLRGEDPTPAVDVFALGALLAYAASGRNPFGDDGADAVLYRVVHEAPLALPAMPRPLVDLVGTCLAKRPEQRPTVDELRTALLPPPRQTAPAHTAPLHPGTWEMPTDAETLSVTQLTQHTQHTHEQAERRRRAGTPLVAGVVAVAVVAVAAVGGWRALDVPTLLAGDAGVDTADAIEEDEGTDDADDTAAATDDAQDDADDTEASGTDTAADGSSDVEVADPDPSPVPDTDAPDPGSTPPADAEPVAPTEEVPDEGEDPERADTANGTYGQPPAWVHDEVTDRGFEVVDASAWDPDATLRAVTGHAAGSATGRGMHVFFFVADHGVIGTDTWDPSETVAINWADDTTIAVDYAIYEDGDPGCCPTGGTQTVRYQWDGERLEPLDDIPPIEGARRR